MVSVAVVKVGGVLLATLSDDLDDSTALRFQAELAERVVSEGAKGVVLDVSAMELVDSFLSRILGDIAAVARVLGARVALVGMRPAVAITLVELGVPLLGVETALSVDAGMALVSRPLDERPAHLRRLRVRGGSA